MRLRTWRASGLRVFPLFVEKLQHPRHLYWRAPFRKIGSHFSGSTLGAGNFACPDELPGNVSGATQSMVFWRAKSAKAAATAPAAAPDSSKPDVSDTEADAASDSTAKERAANDAPPSSNVVALSSGRLTERLAEAASVSEPEAKSDTGTAITAPSALAKAAALTERARRDAGPQEPRALNALKTALAAPLADGHVLFVAAPGANRSAFVQKIAAACARDMAAPEAWIYAEAGGEMKAIAVPREEGARLSHDANAALAASAALLQRLIASDDHKMNLDLLDEEHRARVERPFEQLRRRAEGQNIALVRTLDGFVLAPMHDGRVVRSEVFRSLPDALQRDVETKISGLESELQALAGQMPDCEMEAHQKVAALARQVASRAARPNFAALRASYTGFQSATALFDCIENAFVERAGGWAVSGAATAFDAGRTFCAGIVDEDLGAPVVVARTVAPADLCGEMGRDARGALALRSGHLMAANGGYLVIDAWRLAADPRGWPALSAALETGAICPQLSSGLVTEIASVPLKMRIVLIADEATWSKLETVDPGIEQHFPTVVRFSSREALA